MARGEVASLLAALSALAAFGIRYPLQMLPLLLFEFSWKAIWLVAIALPRWFAHQMDPAITRTLSSQGSCQRQAACTHEVALKQFQAPSSDHLLACRGGSVGRLNVDYVNWIVEPDLALSGRDARTRMERSSPSLTSPRISWQWACGTSVCSSSPVTLRYRARRSAARRARVVGSFQWRQLASAGRCPGKWSSRTFLGVARLRRTSHSRRGEDGQAHEYLPGHGQAFDGSGLRAVSLPRAQRSARSYPVSF
jgi:hypothetical protein